MMPYGYQAEVSLRRMNELMKLLDDLKKVIEENKKLTMTVVKLLHENAELKRKVSEK